MPEEIITPEDHINSLGTLVSYFHTLEFLLRGVLKNHEKTESAPVDYTTLKRGDRIIEDQMTKYDSMTTLIKKYNDKVSKQLKISEEIVATRDVIAQGRVCTSSEAMPMRLFKFGKPVNSVVTVTYAETMDQEWFMKK